jgi:hypothetical protein
MDCSYQIEEVGAGNITREVFLIKKTRELMLSPKRE